MYTVEDRKENKNIVNYTDVTMIQDKKKNIGNTVLYTDVYKTENKTKKCM